MAKRTCHCLQHALTTYLLDAGADLAFVTGNRVPFTLADLVHLLKEQHYPADLEQLKQSLNRLELAFIVQRHGEHYTFCVPLFTKMIQAQEPQLSLQDELRRVHT